MVLETEVQSPVESYQRIKKWCLMMPCLIKINHLMQFCFQPRIFSSFGKGSKLFIGVRFGIFQVSPPGNLSIKEDT